MFCKASWSFRCQNHVHSLCRSVQSLGLKYHYISMNVMSHFSFRVELQDLCRFRNATISLFKKIIISPTKMDFQSRKILGLIFVFLKFCLESGVETKYFETYIAKLVLAWFKFDSWIPANRSRAFHLHMFRHLPTIQHEQHFIHVQIVHIS